MVIWLRGSVLLFMPVQGSGVVVWLFWGVGVLGVLECGGAWFGCVGVLECGVWLRDL